MGINIFTFTMFLSLTFYVYGEKKFSECHYLKYLKLVKDKPDILVFKNVQGTSFPKTRICRFKPNEENAFLVSRTRETFDNHYQYDPNTGSLYQDYVNMIYQVHLSGYQNKSFKLFFELDSVSDYIRSSALDWVTKNLYISDGSTIKVINLKDLSKSPKTLINFKDKNYYMDITHVFPNQGVLVIKSSYGNLTRYNLDISEPHELYSNQNTVITVTISDYYDNNVYWMEQKSSVHKCKILYTDLKGNKVTTLPITDISDCKNLAVDKKYVYFSRMSQKEPGKFSIVRAGKFDGTPDTDFEIINDDDQDESFRFNGIKILNNDFQIVSKDHPCLVDDGYCKGYCFALPVSNVGENLVKTCMATTERYTQKYLY